MNKLIIILLSFLVFAIKINAQENFNSVIDITKAKADLSNLSENTRTIQSSFVQEKHLSFLSEKIISNKLKKVMGIDIERIVQT